MVQDDAVCSDVAHLLFRSCTTADSPVIVYIGHIVVKILNFRKEVPFSHML